MSSENKRSRTEDEVENQTPSKKTKDSIDDNAELTAQQKNDDICEDDTSEPQKHKEMKGYKNMGSDIFVSEKIENIKPENHAQLIADLKERTGLNINRVQIGKIDFLRDTVKIIVYYYEEDPMNSYNEGNTYVSNKNE